MSASADLADVTVCYGETVVSTRCVGHRPPSLARPLVVAGFGFGAGLLLVVIGIWGGLRVDPTPAGIGLLILGIAGLSVALHRRADVVATEFTVGPGTRTDMALPLKLVSDSGRLPIVRRTGGRIAVTLSEEVTGQIESSGIGLSLSQLRRGPRCQPGPVGGTVQFDLAPGETVHMHFGEVALRVRATTAETPPGHHGPLDARFVVALLLATVAVVGTIVFAGHVVPNELELPDLDDPYDMWK